MDFAGSGSHRAVDDGEDLVVELFRTTCLIRDSGLFVIVGGLVDAPPGAELTADLNRDGDSLPMEVLCSDWTCDAVICRREEEAQSPAVFELNTSVACDRDCNRGGWILASLRLPDEDAEVVAEVQLNCPPWQ
ncbi:MAG: hypothetical protein OXT09_08675 [Myxococcales bacterium]|nr:hypothetical protein [Myxococcales bacterium]